jgi:hypothetical protein
MGRGQELFLFSLFRIVSYLMIRSKAVLKWRFLHLARD